MSNSSPENSARSSKERSQRLDISVYDDGCVRITPHDSDEVIYEMTREASVVMAQNILGVTPETRASDTPAPEPPYYVRTFWSPDKHYLVTVHVTVPPGGDCNIIGFQDDDGKEWEPAGEQQNMTAPEPATRLCGCNPDYCMRSGMLAGVMPPEVRCKRDAQKANAAPARCEWGCHVHWSGWPKSHHPNCTAQNGNPQA